MTKLAKIRAGLRKLFRDPTVRLAGRALVAGVTAGIVYYRHASAGSFTWHAAIVAGVLAAAELFTPLNSLVGLFKQKAPNK